MRYFGVGVVMIVVGIPLGLELLSGMGLIVAGGLCFVADAITRLTDELREQSQCAEAVETMRRRGTLPQTNRGGGEQLGDGIRDELGIKAD